MDTISICRVCGLEAPHYDSITTHCKECWKARVRANRLARAEQYRAYDRERNHEAHRKAAFAEKQRTKRKLMGTDYGRAHSQVARAVKNGLIVRPQSCQRCPATEKVQAHHDDHSRPLDVMWLCPVCHAARHKELGRVTNTRRVYDATPSPTWSEP